MKEKTKKPKLANSYKIVRDTNYTPIEAVKITSSESGEKYCRAFFGDDIVIYESFFVVLLNRANMTIGWAKISQGGLSSCIVDVPLVCKYVVDTLAQAVVVCHNHPSGNTKPSEPDKSITQNLKNALKFFGVKLLDHIILTENSYYSFADNGEL
jgi:DNA repair protein RadC